MDIIIVDIITVDLETTDGCCGNMKNHEKVSVLRDTIRYYQCQARR